MKKLIVIAVLLNTWVTFGQVPPPPVAVVQTPAPDAGRKDKDNGNIVDFPDVEAQFVGGVKAMHEFIAKEVNYPEEAEKKNIVGKVYTYFVVKKNGKLSNIKVEQGAHPLLDQEAIRLIQAMPKWVPAEKNGKKVNTACRLPINFTLN